MTVGLTAWDPRTWDKSFQMVRALWRNTPSQPWISIVSTANMRFKGEPYTRGQSSFQTEVFTPVLQPISPLDQITTDERREKVKSESKFNISTFNLFPKHANHSKATTSKSTNSD